MAKVPQPPSVGEENPTIAIVLMSQHEITSEAADLMAIPGLKELWGETLGDPKVCVAVLDGPVDLSHPSFSGANLTEVQTIVPEVERHGPAAQHGTHVTSVIFGQQTGPVRGIAPECRGVIIPVFRDDPNGGIASCSQVDLARAIGQALQHDAHVINISGGEPSLSGTAHPILADAVRKCVDLGVLIVAAAGNDGCDCLHVPGALDSVLAVGAMDTSGLPLDSSNWGSIYQRQAILAPGEHIIGAHPSGGIIGNSGTSYAAAVISGIVALLLSLQRQRRRRVDPHGVRAALLASAVTCNDQPAPDCRRVLGGRLNVGGAVLTLEKQDSIMSDSTDAARMHGNENDTTSSASQGDREAAAVVPDTAKTKTQPVHSIPEAPMRPPSAVRTNAQLANPLEPLAARDEANVRAAACSCGAAPSQLVYALGEVGYDFGTEARRDSFLQEMKEGTSPHNPHDLLRHLKENPWTAASVIWTLTLDATAVYGIEAHGSFACDVLERLRQFLEEQLTDGVERVCVPGVIRGSVQLLNSQILPIIHPDIRGMHSWTLSALTEAAAGPPPSSSEERDSYNAQAAGVRNFLQRVYHETRNLGISPPDRALNFAATNAFNVAHIFVSAVRDGMHLDSVEVERSPLCRPKADCWDCKLSFFNPAKVFEQARKVYRFTVDVSDVIPVTVGEPRSWFIR